MMAERGIFVNLEIAPACSFAQGCRACIEVCPVDIFAVSQRAVVQVRGQVEDECTLCNLCLQHCPAGAISLRRLYLPGEGGWGKP